MSDLGHDKITETVKQERKKKKEKKGKEILQWIMNRSMLVKLFY